MDVKDKMFALDNIFVIPSGWSAKDAMRVKKLFSMPKPQAVRSAQTMVNKITNSSKIYGRLNYVASSNHVDEDLRSEILDVFIKAAIRINKCSITEVAKLKAAGVI